MLNGYEYLTHTADIQVHSWGPTFEDALIESSYALYDYMTDRTSFNEVEHIDISFKFENISKEKLTLSVLDELLFLFSCNPFMVAKRITAQHINDEIQFTLHGEPFIPNRHHSGTEIKAITSSNLRVEKVDSLWHIWVIFDI